MKKLLYFSYDIAKTRQYKKMASEKDSIETKYLKQVKSIKLKPFKTMQYSKRVKSRIITKIQLFNSIKILF